MHNSVFTLLPMFAGLASANFRISCTGLTHERIDPLLSPGKVSQHTHGIFGASALDIQAPSYDQLRKSQCTSCQVKQDNSVYWTPDLYFQWKNGSFSMVPGEQLDAYYYWKDDGSEEILPFPPGFAMISGNPMLRSNQKTVSQKYGAVNFACIGGGNTNTPYLPTQDCPAGLRADIYFPSCWDGKNVVSKDFQSHVAYASNIAYNSSGGESDYGASLPGNGYCPKSHPKRLVSLGLSRLFTTANFDRKQAKNPKQPFVFAMGDPTGYGFHGDFVTGWDTNLLSEAVQQCTHKDGSVYQCPPFEVQPTTQDDEPYAPLCRKTPNVNEIVKDSVMKALPGCNPVQNGPGNAKMNTCAKQPSIFPNPQVYSGPVPPFNSQLVANTPRVSPKYLNYQYQGCYTNSTQALPTKMKVSGPMSAQKCISACATAKLPFCGVQDKICYGGSRIATASKTQDIGQCWTNCAGNYLNYCGGPSGLTVYTLPKSK